MSVRRISVAGLVVAFGLLVSGCAASSGVAEPTPTASVEPAPAPSPEPASQPSLASLAISATGLGPIVVGQAPPTSDSALDTVRLDPAACQNGDYPDTPVWLANYPDTSYAHTERTGPAFFVFTQGGLVTGVSIYAPEPTTAEGVHVGMTRAELVAAYPDAGLAKQGPLSDLYVLTGADGTLAFEVLRETHPNSSYEAAQVDTILKIRILRATGDPMPSATTDGCG